MTLARKPRVDWFRVMDDLKRLGFSLREIERETGIGLMSLHRYKAGGTPSFDTGEDLVEFWCTVMNRPPESVPRIDPYDFRA